MSVLDDETILQLGAYLEGDLDEEARTAFEARLEREPALRAELDGMRATLDALAHLPPRPAPDGFTRGLARRLARRSRDLRSPAPMAGLVQVLAVVAVVLFAMMAFENLGPIRIVWSERPGAGSGAGSAVESGETLPERPAPPPRPLAPALGSGELPPELLRGPLAPGRVSRDPIRVMSTREHRYVVQSSLRSPALLRALAADFGAGDVREGSAGFDVRLDPAASEQELARLLRLGPWRRELVQVPAGTRPAVRVIPVRSEP